MPSSFIYSENSLKLPKITRPLNCFQNGNSCVWLQLTILINVFQVFRYGRLLHAEYGTHLLLRQPNGIGRECLALNEGFRCFIFPFSRLWRPEKPRDVACMGEKTMGLTEHFRMKKIAPNPVTIKLVDGSKCLV